MHPSEKQELPDKPQEETKTTWEKLVLSTPVLMTILATLLAGLSANEMTQAQYHRSLAAQYQSKVSDQWNFFQAKRIRETNTRLSTDLLRALSEPGVLDARALSEGAARLDRELGRAVEEATHLEAAVKTAQPSRPQESRPEVPVRTADSSWQRDATDYLRVVKHLHDEGEKLRQQTDLALMEGISSTAPDNKGQKDRLDPVFKFFVENKLPESKDEDVAGKVQERDELAARRLREAEDEVSANRTEQETAALIHRIPVWALREGCEAADGNRRRFEKVCDGFRERLRALDGMVTAQVDLARRFRRATQDMGRSLPDAAVLDSKELREARYLLAALNRTDAVLKESSEQLYRDLKSAVQDYTARRYSQDAQYNMRSAWLHELQVRKSGLESDRHRSRSRFFFYAMLVAQGGVTIATVSLAYRKKNLFFAFASTAGIIAVSFGSYVFLAL
jgi:hypothetical protein